MPKPKYITFTSADNVDITVELDTAKQSLLIKDMLDDLGNLCEIEEAIPIPNASESVLKKVFEWCDYHKHDSTPDDVNDVYCEEINAWDQNFLQVDQEMLFEIILAANYLDIRKLLDLCCKTVANIIRGKSADEICTIFHIPNDYTLEEKEQIRRENEWEEE
ncbi:SKP1 family protein [Aspergillus tanneri]|nr:uncharacterized protein ATNIH1004_011742 [Aspergillus tanneri]KAA8641606.1 hypothetical protein ATNIH1004_011742 [Aspergillus tanneri]